MREYEQPPFSSFLHLGREYERWPFFSLFLPLVLARLQMELLNQRWRQQQTEQMGRSYNAQPINLEARARLLGEIVQREYRELWIVGQRLLNT
jgi:hypothetical protein